VKITRRVAAAAVTIMALGGAGIGTAAASSAAPVAPHSVSSEPTSPDTDAIQQGNQTAPEPSGSALAKSVSHVRAAAPGDENSSENSESGPSDGPGGHADPSGDVQHQFTGAE
jgi:hypothetical protein